MSSIQDELLNAVIQHLEELKSDGTRFVSVRRETLEALAPSGRSSMAPSPTTGPSVPAGVRPLAKTSARAAASSPLPHPPKNDMSEVNPASAPDRWLPSSELIPPPKASPAANISPVLSPEAKAAAMVELRERACVCVKCSHLAASRKNVVFGVGDIHSPVMFVGEAPGADEDAQGEPFVGRAGQLLTRMIQAMGLSRDRVYIGNVLKCRPDTPGQSSGNRKPTPEEMKTCLPYLMAQIDIIRPKVIVALGSTAMEGLLGQPVGITKLRGHWQNFRDIDLMPTFHPSFLLRPENVSKKRLVWEDMLQVMERLGMPISEKQRNYFLKPGT